MSTQTVAFFVITLMISNQLVMRVGALRSRPLFFWACSSSTSWAVRSSSSSDCRAGSSIRGQRLLGLLFIFRTVQNNMLRSSS